MGVMNNTFAIRLLAAANNERGDLFTRLTKDLFFALGYDDLRLDAHKSGRELDIQGEHRFETRRVVGECKAHKDRMGGTELNTFFGALTRERKRFAPVPVAGYFVSLSGFTETGILQEDETDDDRVILLDAQKVVEALEKCRVIVGRTEAAERAGHCAQQAGLRDAVLDDIELLGHQRGYLWAVFYAQGKKRTHFALIHADGTPLAEAVAQEVINADNLCGGSLHTLRYLAPPAPSLDRAAFAGRVAESYRQWVSEECGYIQLDGLPADTDLSATRLRLERLFVPLKAAFLSKPDTQLDSEQPVDKSVFSIGQLVESTSHLALLAAPGGGKSTLLKRLATAYAFPDRRGEVLDDLPHRDWLPLVLRCRELRDRAHRPIIELLDDIPRHAGMNAEECAVFQESVHSALRVGQALLLVDGLDEISDEGARQTFAKHLRTFLAMFPQSALVVTSREAGFRAVAGVVASVCEQAKVAPLDEDDVLNLCERWHVEVVGDNDKVRTEAKELGLTIWGNKRIRKLAENPLLLTTLLVVKRWIGELPRSRAGLYREAIRVLVRTWNVEGYAPLDEEETLAQLSYVACAMMEEGKQQIGHKALLKLLRNSRQELEAELQFARISPQEFIERIEYRSSLLMQTGYENIDDELQPVYEFRHLTFQEYLAARGYVEEQYPGRNLEQSLADILERHFKDEPWREVIPLAAVLAGRRVEELVKRLTATCKRHRMTNRLGVLLHQCILDEVQVTAPTLRLALIELAHDLYVKYAKGIGREKEWVVTILQGKFGAIFQEAVEQEYLAGGKKFEKYREVLVEISCYLRFADEELGSPDVMANSLRNDLEAGDRLGKIRAALACIGLAYINRDRVDSESTKDELRKHFQLLSSGLIGMLDSSDWPSTIAACWALVWVGGNNLLADLPEPEMISSLYRLWRQQKSKKLGCYPAWALQTQQLLPRDTFSKDTWGDCDLFLRHIITDENFQWSEQRLTALVVGWYRRAPWSDAELVEQLSKFIPRPPFSMDSTVHKLLENLGDAGQQLLEETDRKQAEYLAIQRTQVTMML